MLKTTITLAATATLLAACNSAGPTEPSAPSPRPSFAADHTMPGSPGEPNCRGQTTALVAQAGKTGALDEVTSNGVGGAARDLGFSTAELKAAVVIACAAP
jgi:hypothetical protein